MGIIINRRNALVAFAGMEVLGFAGNLAHPPTVGGALTTELPVVKYIDPGPKLGALVHNMVFGGDESAAPRDPADSLRDVMSTVVTIGATATTALSDPADKITGMSITVSTQGESPKTTATTVVAGVVPQNTRAPGSSASYDITPQSATPSLWAAARQELNTQPAVVDGRVDRVVAALVCAAIGEPDPKSTDKTVVFNDKHRRAVTVILRVAQGGDVSSVDCVSVMKRVK